MKTSRFSFAALICFFFIANVEEAHCAPLPPPPSQFFAGNWRGMNKFQECDCRVSIFECAYAGSGPASSCLVKWTCSNAASLMADPVEPCSRNLAGILTVADRASKSGKISVLGWWDRVVIDFETLREKIQPRAAFSGTGTWSLNRDTLLFDKLGLGSVALTRFIPVSDEAAQDTSLESPAMEQMAE